MKAKIDINKLQELVKDKNKTLSDIAYELEINISNLYTNHKYRRILVEAGRLNKPNK
jgi:hypothetical protein